MTTNKTCAGLGRILVVLLLATACSENSSSPAETAARTRGAPAGFTELAADAAGVVPTAAGEGVADWIDELAKRAESASAAAAITVDDPLDESVFPPDFLPPTILWHDAAGDADLWLIAIEFPEAETIRVLVPGEPPPCPSAMPGRRLPRADALPAVGPQLDADPPRLGGDQASLLGVHRDAHVHRVREERPGGAALARRGPHLDLEGPGRRADLLP
jgi:hypothetical protein